MMSVQHKNTKRQNKSAGKTQRSERRDQSAERKAQSAKTSAKTIASLEDQIAALEEQIAALKELEVRSEESGVRSEKSGVKENIPHSSLLTPHSELSPRIPPPYYPLPTPMIMNVTPIGSGFMRVSWTPVPDASGYVVKYSPDGAFMNEVSAVAVDAPATAVTLSGLRANTTYHVRIQSTGTGQYVDSTFSPSSTAVTGITSNKDTATHLQSLLTELQTTFQNSFTLLPQLETTELNTRDRKRLNGSGVRRYGFIEKTADVAGEFPQFWPGIVDDTEKLNALAGEIEVLRNMLVWLRYVARVVQDLLLIAGDDAFRLAGSYYASARDLARRKNPEAQQVFHMLRLFWHRRHNPTEPTIPEVERDLRALLRDTKDGEIIVRNESDRITKGEKVIIDNTRKKSRNNFKEIETGKVDLSTDVADDFCQ